METATPRARLHPALWVAAVSVTALSIAGIGAIFGWIPAGGAAHASIEAPAPAAAVIEQQQETAESPRVAEPKARLESEAGAVPKARLKRKTGVQSGPPVVLASTPAKAEPGREPVPAPVEGQPATPVHTEPVVLAQAPEAAPVRRSCAECGAVESVREIKQQGEGSGLGAVAGGVLGGLLGHQIGKGRGNTVATVAGAVGGAVAGHQVERTVKSVSRHEITVRMDDGSLRTVSVEGAAVWRTGERVRVVDGKLFADN